jgi:ClpP class serine protease
MQNAIQITVAQPSVSSQPDADLPATRRISAFDLVAATPWAIQPGTLDTIAAIARREGDGVEAVEAKLGRPLQNARSVTLRDGVAVVPVTGPIFRYANLMTEVSGATSIEVLAKDFTAAQDDPQVAAIVLDINSPGGQVTGIAEFADMVRAAKKPVVAYVDGTAASAAYWIAAAAGEVVMAKNAMAGNVGAVLSLDLRKNPDKGEIVSSQSPNKRPDAATDSGRAQLQSLVDAQAQVFIDSVAAFRGKTAEAVVADWNGGAVFIAAEAVKLGLADRVGSLEEVVAGLAGKQQIKPAIPQSLKGNAMNLEELRAAHPDLCLALVEEGRIAGAAAERQRIHEIEAQMLPGHEALIAQFKADGQTTAAEAAITILKAEREIAAKRASEVHAGAPAPVPHAAAPVEAPAGTDASLPLDERCKATWDKSADLRAEFAENFNAYLAFEKAQASGRVRVLAK